MEGFCRRSGGWRGGASRGTSLAKNMSASVGHRQLPAVFSSGTKTTIAPTAGKPSQAQEMEQLVSSVKHQLRPTIFP
jgi:hypothetical protein